MAKKVFINYRRAQNLKDAQLLEKILHRTFGASRVFLDTSGLDGGRHWLHTLEAQVDASAAMVSLIGKGWASATGEKGTRLLDNPDDFVRIEIARAFARKIPVLPVLIDGASMPDAQELPRNLLPLLFPQAMLLRSESFNDDAAKIASRLKALITEARGSRTSPAIQGGVALAALIAGIAAGPAILTRTGLLQPPTDVGLRDALARAQRKADEAQSAIAASLSAKEDAVRQVRDAQTALNQMRDHAAQSEQRAKSAQSERDQAQSALKEARKKLAAAEDLAKTAVAERDDARAKLGAAEERMKATAAERDEARAKLAAAEERAKTAVAERDEARDKLAAAEERAKTAVAGRDEARPALEAPKNAAAAADPAEAAAPELKELGLSLTEPPFSLPFFGTGMIIEKVEPDSKAADQELRPGDEIIELNGVKIQSLADAVNAIRRARELGDNALVIKVSTKKGDRRRVTLSFDPPK